MLRKSLSLTYDGQAELATDHKLDDKFLAY